MKALYIYGFTFLWVYVQLNVRRFPNLAIQRLLTIFLGFCVHNIKYDRLYVETYVKSN